MQTGIRSSPRGTSPHLLFRAFEKPRPITICYNACWSACLDAMEWKFPKTISSKIARSVTKPYNDDVEMSIVARKIHHVVLGMLMNRKRKASIERKPQDDCTRIERVCVRL